MDSFRLRSTRKEFLMLRTSSSLLVRAIRSGIIPIVENLRLTEGGRVPDHTYGTIKTLFDAGIPMVEVADRHDSIRDAFQELVARLAGDGYPADCIAVGTVTDGDAAHFFIQNGAAVIISQAFYPDVAVVCQQLNVPHIPGCFDAYHAKAAMKGGAAAIKLYPAEKPDRVQGIRQAFADERTPFIASHGPKWNDLEPWFRVGMDAVVLGKSFLEPGLEGNFTLLEQRARGVLASVVAYNEVVRDY